MDDFDDDTFDALPASALQELENNALQLTQAPPAAARQARLDSAARLSDDDFDFEDKDLDDAVVTNDSRMPVVPPLVDRSLPAQTPRLVPALQRLSVAPNVSVPAPPPSSQLHHPQSVFTQKPPQPSQFARPPPRLHNIPPQSQAAPAGPSDSVINALQQRVRALEAELNLARGEVSIIRSNSVKEQQAHDAEVARLKKHNAEQLAKREWMVEQAVAAEKSATTELQFLQSDMREESSKAKRKESGPGAGLFAKPVVPVTPKKTTKTFSVADGFDDMDIVMSPSRGQAKTKNSGSVAVPVAEKTPTKGKRKRPMVDSPVMALETHTDETAMAELAVPKVDRPGLSGELSVFERRVANFLPIILERESRPDEGPALDKLARCAFPSDPTTSLAAIIYRHIPLMGDPSNPLQLPAGLAQLLITLWLRSCEENYYEPIYALCSLLSCIYDMYRNEVAIPLASSLLPIAQNSIYLVANRRYRRVYGEKTPDDEVLEKQIDTTMIVRLILLTGQACYNPDITSQKGNEKKPDEFWELMLLEIVLLLLTPKQELDDIFGMLEILSLKVLPGSIGPILKDKEPELVARLVIEMVSALLVDLPRAATCPRKAHRVQLCALKPMLEFLTTEFGARQLAVHANAIPRLVLTMQKMHDELRSTAYAWLPESPKTSNFRDDLWDVFTHEHEVAERKMKESRDGVGVDEAVIDIDEAEAANGVANPAIDVAGRDHATEGQQPAERDGATKDKPLEDTDMDITDVYRAHGETPDLELLNKARFSVRDVFLRARHVKPLTPELREDWDQDYGGTNKVLAQCTFVVWRLVTHEWTAQLIDMREKMDMMKDYTIHKYQLLLGKLNWAGDDMRDSGISDKTSEMAHELLELSLTPEEERDLKEFFEVVDAEGTDDEEDENNAKKLENEKVDS